MSNDNYEKEKEEIAKTSDSLRAGRDPTKVKCLDCGWKGEVKAFEMFCKCGGTLEFAEPRPELH